MEAKKKTQKKQRAKNYDKKLAVNVSFQELVNITLKGKSQVKKAI